jgi:ATP-dependent Clp protease ATP-binding subunit ClpA
MYPFERFTERAKKVLTLAQDEAASHHHSYIGTEHVLLGLLREPEGAAARALASLGVEQDEVRDAMDALIGSERVVIGQIIPTSRVKKVIELAFEEARRMGAGHVGTEHLLLGLVAEGEGIAARVLADLGAGEAAVRAAVDRALAEPAGRRQVLEPVVPAVEAEARRTGIPSLIAEARSLAAAEGTSLVGAEHVLLALAAPDTAIGQALAGGLDLPGAGARLHALARAAREGRAEEDPAAVRRATERFQEAMAAFRRDLGLSS